MLLHTDSRKHDREAIFTVNGSLAALMSEKCWERLLAGEAYGVIEPDPNRWSLYIGGSHIKTYTSGNLRTAIKRVYREHPELCDWVVMPGEQEAESRPGQTPHYQLSNGYPYLMALEPHALERYRRAGVDARKTAKAMRELLKIEFRKLHGATMARNVKAADILGGQIHLHGMKREGRD